MWDGRYLVQGTDHLGSTWAPQQAPRAGLTQGVPVPWC